MYYRKSVGPRMGLWGAPALTGYSCGDFSFRTTRSRFFLRNKKNKVKYLTWNSRRPNFVKKNIMPNSVKSLGYIKCYISSSLRPVKDLAILFDTTVRKSAADRETLKPYWKSEKRSQNNDWVFVYKLSGCGFGPRCCDLYLDCFKCFKLN